MSGELDHAAQGNVGCAVPTGEKPEEPDAKARRDARKVLLELVSTIERLMGDLMNVSDRIRREALDAYAGRDGAATDDGLAVSRGPKVGRNEACPCGSGKKWKRCCGAPERVQ